jgi:hypothetical protein
MAERAVHLQMAATGRFDVNPKLATEAVIEEVRSISSFPPLEEMEDGSERK